MPGLQNTLVALRFSGDDLDPDQLTLALGVEPSRAHRKGDPIPASGATGVRKSGIWMLRAADRTPGDLDSQISEILAQLPDDPELWKRLMIYTPDMSMGLFLREPNEGIRICADVIQALAVRGIELDFDVYGPIMEISAGELRDAE